MASETLTNRMDFKVRELLTEVQFDYSPSFTKLVDETVSAIREAIHQIPEDLQVMEDVAPDFVKDIRADKVEFKFKKPKSIEIGGSYIFKILILCSLWKECFHEKDYMNYRYHAKRFLYLCIVKKYLKLSSVAQKVEWFTFQNEARKPILVVHPAMKLIESPQLVVRTIPTATSVFNVSKLNLDRNNVRALNQGGVLQATPKHNSSMLEDLFLEDTAEFVKRTFLGWKELGEALILLKELKRLMAYASSSADLLAKLILHDQPNSYRWECLFRTALSNCNGVVLLHRDKLPYPQRLNQKLFPDTLKVWYDSLGGDAVGLTWERLGSMALSYKRGREVGEEEGDLLDVLKNVGEAGKGFVRSIYFLKAPRLFVLYPLTATLTTSAATSPPYHCHHIATPLYPHHCQYHHQGLQPNTEKAGKWLVSSEGMLVGKMKQPGQAELFWERFFNNGQLVTSLSYYGNLNPSVQVTKELRVDATCCSIASVEMFCQDDCYVPRLSYRVVVADWTCCKATVWWRFTVEFGRYKI
ncbi:hypothetical protein Acr_05g0000200 [Actinidia rufa]|uniref:Nrap protein domain-containing protein n=1 Tax=Actinidia rufa TaxID=165716 RepID=A0A7J0EIT3_9ERIC|nr:hypothetical protein Acr_05g0000200 [Actinidia rufa]